MALPSQNGYNFNSAPSDYRLMLHIISNSWKKPSWLGQFSASRHSFLGDCRYLIYYWHLACHSKICATWRTARDYWLLFLGNSTSHLMKFRCPCAIARCLPINPLFFTWKGTLDCSRSAKLPWIILWLTILLRGKADASDETNNTNNTN